MTTTDAELNIKDVYTSQQVTRLAALQGVSEFVYVLSGTINPDTLIELAEYVIGDDEPFDPVAEAHKAMAAIRYERGEDYNGYDDDEPYLWVPDDDDEGNPGSGATEFEAEGLTDWERELVAGFERGLGIEGDITVSDLAGFLALPNTAILEDGDGDLWTHDEGGWGFLGGRYTAEGIFEGFGDSRSGEFDFIVTNPEVLS